MKTLFNFSSTFAMLAMMLFMCVSCSGNNTDEPEVETNVENNTENPEQPTIEYKARVDIELTETEKQLARQSADFSIRLLQAVDQTRADKKQIVLSPLSASFALSMVSNGANGETRKELLDALGFNGFTIEEVNDFNKTLIQELAGLCNVVSLGFANSLWLDNKFKANETFKGILASGYDAEMESVDFGDAKTIDLINEWCEKKTEGRIQDLLETLPSDSRFVLLNTIHFKGKWENEFKKTEAGKFLTEEGTEQDAEYMCKHETKYPYMENEDYSMVGIGYGNGAYSFVVLLPKEGKQIADIIKGLTGEKWLESISGMKTETLNLKLPKFKVENKKSIADALIAMGIDKAFAKDADFSALANEDTYLTDVLQGNYISVDEKGTEAASVTVVSGALESPEEEFVPIDFDVNRPFLYFIKEKSTNTILFMGKMGQITN